MKQVNIHEAKTHLSSLIEETVNGAPFIIAKAGKPKAIVYSYTTIQPNMKRTGFMPDINIPDDFDSMDAEIEALFLGEDK